MKQNFIKLFKTAIISLILLLFINVKSQGQMTLNFRPNADTIYPFKDVSFINTSTNVRMGTVFKWKFINGLYNSHLGTLYNIEKTTYSVSDSVTCFFNASDTIHGKLYAFYNNVCIDSISKTYKLNSYKIYSCQPSDPCMIMCNNGFEDTATLGHAYHYFLLSANDAIAWDGTNIGNPQPTPDLFVRNYSYNYGRSGIPDNNFGTLDNSNINGNVYAGIITYLLDNNGNPMGQREFIHQPLSRPLVAGRKYLVGMYYALADASAYGSDNLGICLTVNQNTQQGVGNPSSPTWINSFIPDGVLNPQVKLNHVVDYKGYWTKLQDTITATDNYQHLYVGGFKGNNNTQYFYLGNYSWPDQTSPNTIPDVSSTGTYYYIDSVFVIPIHNGKHNPIKICLGKDTIINAPSPPPGTGDMIVENSWYNTATGQTTYDQAQYNIHVSGNNTIICTTTETYFYNPNNPCTTKDTFYITAIHPKPIISTSGNYCFGDSITFTGSALPCEDGITDWNWNFGNGDVIHHIQSPNYAFPSPGTYNVTLIITDISGDTHDTTLQITIEGPVDISVTGPNNSCGRTAHYTILNMLYEGGIYQYRKVPGTGWVGISSPQFTVTYPNNTDTANLYIRYVSPHGCISADTIHIFACCYRGDTNQLVHDSIVSTSGTLNRATKFFNGTVTFNANVTIKRSMIYMGPEAKIVVNPGYTLVLDSTTLQQHCDYMWDGIYADDASSLIRIDSSSTIQDAINGIVSSNGAQLFLRRSFFRKNYNNVIIKNFTSGNHSAYISGCLFSGNTTSPYLLSVPPRQNMPTFSGIRLDSVGNLFNSVNPTIYAATIGDTNGVQVGGTFNATNNPLCNTFQDMYRGIYSTRSNVKIFNCNFKWMNVVSGCRAILAVGKKYPSGETATLKNVVNVGGSNAKRVVITNSEFGIVGDTNIDLNVLKNYFCNVTNGIVYGNNLYYSTTNPATVKINYNTLKRCSLGITAINNNYTTSFIQYNTIDDTATSTISTIGIYAIGTSNIMESFKIDKNIIKLKGIGIYVINNYMNLKVRYNNIFLKSCSATQVGIALSGVGGLGSYCSIYADTVIAQTAGQPTIGTSCETSSNVGLYCNEFRYLSFAMNFQGANLVNHPDAGVFSNTMRGCTQGIFKSNNANIGKIGTPTLAGGNMWYTPYSYQAYAYTGSAGEPIYFKNVANHIVSSGYTQPFYPYSGYWQLFNLGYYAPLFYCDYNQSLLSSPIQINGTQNSDNSLFDKIATGNMQYFGPYDEYLTKYSMYSIIQDDTASFVNDNNIQLFNASCRNSSMGAVIKAVRTLNEGDILNSELLNNAIVSQNIIEESQQFVNNCKIEYYKTGIIQQQHVNELRVLAKQCPFEYGPAVYRARAIMASYDPLVTLYANECETLPFKKNKSMLVNNNSTSIEESQADYVNYYNLYPNPASEQLSFEYAIGGVFRNASLEIFNLTGTMVYNKTLSDNESKLNIDLANLRGGIYFYKVIIDGRIDKTEKLVIIK